MSLRHAILGFLAVHPMTGYDLRKAMAGELAQIWPADQAQIYRTLRGLLDEGFVTVETEPQHGRPDRRVHRLLPAGEAALDHWLAAPLGEVPKRDPFLLRLYLGGRLGAGPLRGLLTLRIGDMKREIAARNALRDALKTDAGQGLSDRLRRATHDHALAHARAELDWAQALYDEIGRRPG